MEHVFLTEQLNSMKDPSISGIIDLLSTCGFDPDNTTILGQELKVPKSESRCLYIERDRISWSKLNSVVGRFSKLTHLLVVTREIYGPLYPIDKPLAVFALLVRGSYPLYTKWIGSATTLHIYYQEDPIGDYNEAPANLIIMNTSRQSPEPIESLLSQLIAEELQKSLNSLSSGLRF